MGKRYLQITAYVLIAAIFVFLLGISRDCSHLKMKPHEGYSGGDTIDVALLFVPGSYYFYDDSIGGINKEIAEAFSRDNNVPVKLWPVNEITDGLNKLEKGAFDIFASLPLDNNIKQQFPVTESVFLDRLVLVQLTDSVSGETKINSTLDLHNQRVHVVKGSSSAQRLSNLSDEIGGDIEIIEEPELSEELLTLKVSDGTIPLAVVNERIASKIADINTYLKYDSNISFTQFQVWLFNSADSLELERFNRWFDDFRVTDEYREIINKYKN